MPRTNTIELPANAGTTPSTIASEGAKLSVSRAVVTHILVVISVLVYFAMTLFHSRHGVHDSPDLLRWGANFAPLTVGGQWWRLVTSIFVHVTLLHLAVNMWCLWDLGSFGERVYGRATFLAIYIASGEAGAMASLLWHPFAVEAGASGAIFGVAGALIASFCFGELPFPRQAAKAALFSIVAFAGYNLFIGMVGNGTGNAAHVGGLTCGFLVGVCLARLPYRWMTVSVTVACLLIGWATLMAKQGYVAPAERGRTALAEGHPDVAVRELSQSVVKNPRFEDGYVMLAHAYLQQGRFAESEKAYRGALALDPQAYDVRYELGTVLLAQRRSKEALIEFHRIMEAQPSDGAAQMGIGTATALEGNYERAFEAFRLAAKLDPANPQAYLGLGSAALQLSRPDDAIAAFEKLSNLQPEDPNALLNLAVAYKAKGMEHEAEQAYQRAVKLSMRK